MRRLILTLLLVAVPGFAANPKIARELEHFPSDTPIDVIVQYRQEPTARQHAKIRNNHGGELRHHLGVIRAGAYSGIQRRYLEQIANDPDVENISADNAVFGSLDNTAGAVGAQAAWSKGLFGSGIGVAVIDSGVAAEYFFDNMVSHFVVSRLRERAWAKVERRRELEI